MDFQSIAPLAAAVAATDWKWDAAALEAILAQFGWRKQQEIAARVDYQTGDDRPASVYRDQQAPSMIHIYLSVLEETEDLDDDELDEKYEAFHRQWVEVVELLSSSLGAPTTTASYDEGELADDYGAMHLALWQLQGASSLLTLEHQDKELPIMLVWQIHPPISLAAEG